jgi:hypothetical protein
MGLTFECVPLPYMCKIKQLLILGEKILINVFFGFLEKMKNWLPRFFLSWFSSNTIFLQSKVRKTKNVVIRERAYIILEIMSI